MTKRKRGYSREFSPRSGKGRRYLLDQIPPSLWDAFQQQCRHNGVSVRTALLTLVRDSLSAAATAQIDAPVRDNA